MICETTDIPLRFGLSDLAVAPLPVRGPSTAGAGSKLDPAAVRELMIRYQVGDIEAVEALVVRLSPVLLRFLSAPNLTRDVAEDVLQDFWLRLHRSRHTYRASEPVLPWVYAIARHTALDAYRRRRRIQSREFTRETIPETPHWDSPAQPGDSRVMHAVELLPESQREVILMLKVTGLSLEEVARALSTSVGSIKQKAHRAYRRLRVLLEEDQLRQLTANGSTGFKPFPSRRSRSAA